MAQIALFEMHIIQSKMLVLYLTPLIIKWMYIISITVHEPFG